MHSISWGKTRCPICGGEVVRRSHRRNWLEKLVSLVGVVPYRCRECYHRFYRF